MPKYCCCSLTAAAIVFVVFHSTRPLDLQFRFSRHSACQSIWIIQNLLYNFHKDLTNSQFRLGRSFQKEHPMTSGPGIRLFPRDLTIQVDFVAHQ
mmetsp:Transcript_37951/g.109154  ORF Transcript_37951/g.109154 Transcript_37951/m.109154 type:complete len:95 (+) Transcript_37951:142-426(+)